MSKISRNTPLHVAAESGSHEVCALLLKAKADPTLQNDFNLEPWALAEGGTPVFDLLTKHIDGSKGKSKRRGGIREQQQQLK